MILNYRNHTLDGDWPRNKDADQLFFENQLQSSVSLRLNDENVIINLEGDY